MTTSYSSRGRNYLLRNSCREAGAVPIPLTWPSNEEIQWQIKFYDDRLSGYLQRPEVDPVCWEPSARGHHTGFAKDFALSMIC